MKGELIRLEKVGKAYQLDGVRVEALRPTSLVIGQGEYISIMGPSGSGKSTLMHILGLLDNSSDGKLIFGGRDVTNLSEAETARIRNKEIGFVFQQFNLLPKTEAWKNVGLPLIYSGVSRAERRRRAVELLSKLGLGERIDHTPSQLSGGQQQRVAIARALINNPKVIFADEPTGNLDSKTGKEIMEIFDGLNKEGKTVILVTHEKEVARRAKRHLRILDGVVKERR